MVRPTTPLIDRQVAIETALDIIDIEGLDAISMRYLADRLGVASASLYHHFHNKEELLQAVCSLIFIEIPVPDERIEEWTDFVARTAFKTRQIMLRHPNALPLMARFTPRQVVPHIYERFGNLLLKRGVPVDMISVTLTAFDTLVIGSATVKLARGDQKVGKPDAQPGSLADWERANPRSEEEVFQLMCRALGDGLGLLQQSPRTKRGRSKR
jgi:TetR/AcrR family tetracycline transcriptional repressor